MKPAKILIIAVILALSGTVSYFLFKELMKEDNTTENTTEEQEEEIQETEDEFKVKLSLEQQGTANLNETGTITLKIDTSMYEIPGLDVVLTYDPTIIEVQSVDNGILENYLVKEINSDLGIITISAVTSPGNLFKGTGTITTLNVKYLKIDQTQMVISEDSEKTNVPLVGGTSSPLELENLTINITEKTDQTTTENDLLERE